MVAYCCVKDCRNNSAEKKKVFGPCSSVTFHSFPSNPDARSKWLKAIGRASWEPPSYARICSVHFTPAQIKREHQRTRLTEDACPVNELPENFFDFDSSAMEVCRICLVTDVRMFSLQLATLKNCFKSIVGLNKEIEGLPQSVCYECASQLIKCYNLIQKSSIAKSTLLNIFAKNGEVTKGLVKLVNRDQIGLLSSLAFNAVVPKTVVDLHYDEDLKKYTFLSKTEENVCPRRDTRHYPKVVNEADAYKVEVNTDFVDNDSCDMTSDNNFVNVNVNSKDEEDADDPDGYNMDVAADDNVDTKLEVDIDGVREKKPRKPRKKIANVNKNEDGLTPDEVEMQQYFDVVTLTLEQQIEERDRQKESPAYRDALYKCETCYKTYMHPNAFKVHVDNHDPSRGPAECPVCKLRFKSEVLARSHGNRTHAKRFYCKSCPKVFNYVRIAKIHQKRHEGFVYKCPFCEFSTLHESALGLHVRGQHPARHACALCGQGFASERGLLLHAQRTCPRQRDGAGALHCKECDTQFSSEEMWRAHVFCSPSRKKHDGNVCLEDSTSCPRCGERLPSAAMLQRHLAERHARKLNWHLPGGTYPHHCEHCGESVNNRKEHYTHIRKVHPKERDSYQPVITAVCDTCGKGFQNSTKLHLHELRHRGSGTVRCPHCPRLFYDKYQLARHVGVHSDARPFACQLCDKAFKLRSNLDRHAKVHTGVTPYECTMCGKRFRYSSSRNLHIRTVHYKMPHPPRKKRAAKRAEDYDDHCVTNV